jgi:8-oxo-dGTP pyrophosphatase MutT (NUDIX family)
VVETVWRSTVRVLLLDSDHRILLMHWRDPVDGHRLWEPPGGGIEPGESETAAAVREVLEETGIAITPVPGRRVEVHRDLLWCGRRFVGDEPFLLARVPSPDPMRPARLTQHERDTLLGWHWLTWPEVLALADPVEPPTLAAALRALEPTGPW